MKVLATPITYQIRAYKNVGSAEEAYKDRLPYAAIMTLQVMGNVGYVSGYHGDIDLATRRELKKLETELGLERVTWHRDVDREVVAS